MESRAGLSLKRTWLPADLLRAPVVILDSGQSVAHSQIIEAFRIWLLSELRSRPSSHGRHAVYALYANPDQASWYGREVDDERYEAFEVRPIRRGRGPHRHGILRSYCDFETACYRGGHVPPWRRNTNSSLRACVIWPFPLEHELRWARRNIETWGNPQLLSSLHLFAFPNQSVSAIPRGAFWVLDDETKQRIDASFGRNFSTLVPWQDFFPSNPSPRFDISVAGDNGCILTQRTPGIAKQVLAKVKGSVRYPSGDASWNELMESTDARFYVLLTRKESTFPVDALVASARGCQLILPDTPLFRSLPIDAWYYPCYRSGIRDHVGWNVADVFGWFANRFRAASLLR